MNKHDYSKRDFVKQYPPWFVSSKPKPPKFLKSKNVPYLNLKYYSDEIPEPETTNLSNENTRAYIERMKKVVC